MSLYSLRRQIDSLKRRLPIHYKVALLRPYAEQFCYDWQWAIGMGHEPPPFFSDSSVSVNFSSVNHSRRAKLKPFMSRVSRLGIGSRTWKDVRRYLNRCRDERVYPHPDDILRLALPRAVLLELIPPSPAPVSYPALTTKPPQNELGPSRHPGHSEESQSDRTDH